MSPVEEQDEQEVAAQEAAEQAEYERLRAQVERRPRSADAWRELGQHCYTFHRTDEAVAAWRESLRLDPKQADLHWNLGTIHHGRNEDELAQAEYEIALGIDPDHTGTLNNLGVLYTVQGRYDDAERLLLRSTAINGTGFGSLGRLYSEQGRWQEAADAFAHSLERPHLGLAGKALGHGELGLAQLHLGRDDEAMGHLDVALESFLMLEQHPLGGRDHPMLAEVLFGLSRLYARGGDPDLALNHLRRALSRDPTLRDRAATEPDLAAVRRLPEAADLEFRD